MPASPPRLSLYLPTYADAEPHDWAPLVELAVAADDAGIDRVVVPEHVVFGQHMDAYADPRNGGQRGGRQPTGPDGPWLDPLVVLSYLAAVTTRVRLGTSILQAALRRPVVLAKTAATLDVLSRGRLDLGVGVGWQREEYEAAGLAFGSRGRQLDHTLEVCQRLWATDGPVSYDSDGLCFAGIHLAPKPWQGASVPIWVSGTVNERTMDRLARFGVGWIAWGDDATDIESGIAKMRAALDQRGRDPDGVLVTTQIPNVFDGVEIDFDATFARAPDLYRRGVTDFRIHIPRLPADIVRDGVLDRAVAAFHASVGER